MKIHSHEWFRHDLPGTNTRCPRCGFVTANVFDCPTCNGRVDLQSETIPREIHERLVKEKDAAYFERNQVVAALAKLFPSGIARTAIAGWDSEWHGCVYIDLPTGQVSWHFHDSHGYLFAGLPAYEGKWDGHDTNEKYQRLACITRADLMRDAKAQALRMVYEAI
jgi:hypothetical protein